MSPKSLFVSVTISTDPIDKSAASPLATSAEGGSFRSHEVAIAQKLLERVAYAVLNSDGRVAFCSDSMAEFFNLSMEELNRASFNLPQSGKDFFGADSSDPSSGSRSWTGPIRVSTDSKGEWFIEATVSDLIDDRVLSDRLLAIFGGTSLSGSGLVPAAAEDREARLEKLILKNLPDAVVITSDRNIVYANNAAIHLLDAGSMDSLVGKNPLLLFAKKHHRDLHAWFKSLEEDFRSIPSLPLDVVVRYGRQIEAAVDMFSFESHGQALVALVIKAREKVEDEPCLEAKRLVDCQRIVENFPISFFQVDEFGRVQDWNDFFRDEVAHLEAAMPDESVFTLIDEKDHRKAVRHFAKTLRYNRDETEITVRSKCGKISHFLVKSFRLDTHECRAIASIAIDISWKLDIEERLIYERDYANAVLNCLPGVFYHYDSNMKLVRWNKNHEKITGYGADELNGAGPLYFIAEEMRELVSERIGEVFRVGSAHVEADYLIKSGERIPYLFTAVAFEHRGQVGFVGTGTDITEQKNLESSLMKQTALFRAQVESSQSGILVTDVSGARLIQNQIFNEMWGISEDVSGIESTEDVFRFVANKTPAPDEFISRVEWLSANADLFSTEEIELNDGRIIERFSGPVLGPDGTNYGRNWIHRDITKRKRFERKIRYMATHDALTTLSNRSAAQERIETAMASNELTGSKFAVLFIDLDRFKIINDGFGHPFGDAVLKEAAMRLKKLARKKDVVARYGGDEFLVVLSNTETVEDACAFAQSVVDVLEIPIVVNGREIFVSGSVGISMYPDDGKTSASLIDCANLAMYRAKELGRSNCQVFTTQLSNEVQRSVTIETRLRRAIDSEELTLVYQPKVSLVTGKITGCEALVRWEDSELGAVSPNEFIPIAEDSGLIVPLGDWVLRTACRQAMEWKSRGMPDICVAVNVSNRQFLQYDLFDWVMETLTASGMPPEMLEIELTERIISQDVQKALNDVNLLREVGVKFSIDDFGTGYSSLTYLSQFRMDTLKIDQAFIRNMLTYTQDANIVRTIITMAHNLGFKAIAEGVESEAQCEILAGLKCDEIQGHYFSHPVEPHELELMVKAHKRISDLLPKSTQPSNPS